MEESKQRINGAPVNEHRGSNKRRCSKSNQNLDWFSNLLKVRRGQIKLMSVCVSRPTCLLLQWVASAGWSGWLASLSGLFLSSPAGRRVRGRSRARWSEHISHLAWKHLGSVAGGEGRRGFTAQPAAAWPGGWAEVSLRRQTALSL